MEAEIKAGAKLDMLTKSELQEVMDGLDFNVKIGRGLKFRRIELSIPVDATGQVPERHIGPDNGFTWCLMAASSYYIDTADFNTDQHTIHYLNNISPIATMFWTGTTGTGSFGSPSPETFPKGAWIIHSGDSIVPQVFTPVATAVPFLQVAYNVIEVPVFSEGLLNL